MKIYSHRPGRSNGDKINRIRKLASQAVGEKIKACAAHCIITLTPQHANRQRSPRATVQTCRSMPAPTCTSSTRTSSRHGTAHFRLNWTEIARQTLSVAQLKALKPLIAEEEARNDAYVRPHILGQRCVSPASQQAGGGGPRPPHGAAPNWQPAPPHRARQQQRGQSPRLRCVYQLLTLASGRQRH